MKKSFGYLMILHRAVKLLLGALSAIFRIGLRKRKLFNIKHQRNGPIQVIPGARKRQGWLRIYGANRQECCIPGSHGKPERAMYVVSGLVGISRTSEAQHKEGLAVGRSVAMITPCRRRAASHRLPPNRRVNGWTDGPANQRLEEPTERTDLLSGDVPGLPREPDREVEEKICILSPLSGFLLPSDREQLPSSNQECGRMPSRIQKLDEANCCAMKASVDCRLAQTINCLWHSRAVESRWDRNEGYRRTRAQLDPIPSPSMPPSEALDTPVHPCALRANREMGFGNTEGL